jgi:hypothetical protein
MQLKYIHLMSRAISCICLYILNLLRNYYVLRDIERDIVCLNRICLEVLSSYKIIL